MKHSCLWKFLQGSLQEDLRLASSSATFSWHILTGICHSSNIPWSVPNFISVAHTLPFACSATPPSITTYPCALHPFTLQAQRSVLPPQNSFTFYVFLSIPEVLHSLHLDYTEPTVLWSAPGDTDFSAQVFHLWQRGYYLPQLWSSIPHSNFQMDKNE